MMMPDFCAFITGAARLRAEEVGVEADFEALAPLVELHVLDGRGGALDAGIVHQHVEAAQVFQRIVEPGVDLALAADVHLAGGDVGELAAELRERLLVHVADVDLGALGREGAGDGLADAVRRGGDHHALLWHGRSSRFVLWLRAP